MFNLGYKQIVINSDAVVVETAGASGKPQTIAIEGYGTFTTTPTDTVGNTTGPSAPVLGIATGTLAAAPALVVGDVLDVKVTLKGAPRILSEFFPGGGNLESNGEVLAYQAIFAAGVGDDIQAGILPGFNDKILAFSGGALIVTATFVAGLEGLNVAKIEVYNTTQKVSIPVTTVNTVEGTEGIGQGKQIEAEVRNATFDNIDPYGIQFGGNSSVDVRGTYQTIMWERAVSINDWESHTHLGYGDANTSTSYAPVKFIAYVNSLATAAITSIEKLATNTADTL